MDSSIASRVVAGVPNEREQDTVSLSKMENAKLSIRGRHDPCVVLRAVPVVEAVAALAVLDLLLDSDTKEV